MCGIPLDVERRFERRWAAKLASPAASATPKSVGLKDTIINLPRPYLEARSSIPSPEKKEAANRATSSY
jgi:hypothetical protein